MRVMPAGILGAGSTVRTAQMFYLRPTAAVARSGPTFPAGTNIVLLEERADLRDGTSTLWHVRVVSTGAEGWALLSPADRANAGTGGAAAGSSLPSFSQDQIDQASRDFGFGTTGMTVQQLQARTGFTDAQMGQLFTSLLARSATPGQSSWPSSPGATTTTTTGKGLVDSVVDKVSSFFGGGSSTSSVQATQAQLDMVATSYRALGGPVQPGMSAAQLQSALGFTDEQLRQAIAVIPPTLPTGTTTTPEAAATPSTSIVPVTQTPALVLPTVVDPWAQWATWPAYAQVGAVAGGAVVVLGFGYLLTRPRQAPQPAHAPAPRAPRRNGRRHR